jgi:hypothetical protein
MTERLIIQQSARKFRSKFEVQYSYLELQLTANLKVFSMNNCGFLHQRVMSESAVRPQVSGIMINRTPTPVCMLQMNSALDVWFWPLAARADIDQNNFDQLIVRLRLSLGTP